MPLHGRKIFNAAPPLTDVAEGEKIFTIEHTKEQFRSESEYEKRLALYKEKNWTCQCTGHINLSHEQAWKSEQEKTDLLKKQFPEYFEKPVLEIVHHNTTILDDLVDQTWTRLQQVLAPKEPVALKVRSGGQEMTGVVSKLDTCCSVEAVNGTSDGECNSPSSDKENKTNEDEGDSSFKSSPSKWQPPRLLPFKYTVSMDDSDQVISGIPASDLKRLKRTPSKELVKLFIRSCAHRPGLNSASPWVVKEDLVKKHNIPSKFADIFMSPKAGSSAKISETGKKRKASLTPTRSLKKPKLEDSKQKGLKNKSVLKPNTSSNSPKKSASPKKAATPRKSTPTTPKTPVVEIDSSSDSSDSDSSAEDEMPLSDIKAGKSPVSSPKKKEKSLADIKKELEKKAKVSKKRKEKETKKGKSSKEGSPKKRARPSAEGSSPSKKAKTASKKNLKQMTLFDMKGKKKSGDGSKNGTPKKSSPKKQTPVRQPPIVTKLQKAIKKNESKSLIGQLVSQCAKVLKAQQRAALPDTVKEMVLKKYELIEEKKKMEAMTPEEKEEYLKQKRKEVAKKQLEKRMEQNKRFEDQDLKSAPLPTPKLVPTPDGLPNELFGEVAMVTQFISCYKKLLMPDDECNIMTDQLMTALVADKAGFAYLTKTLQVLLQTLLQDGVAEEYKELTVALKSVTVTQWNVSELVRLCLRKHDADDAASRSAESKDSEDDALDEEDEVPEELVDQLETEEIYSLRPEEKLQILSGLCARIMNSYSVQDFMEEKQREASELWRQKVKTAKEKKKAGGKDNGEKSKKKPEGKSKENSKNAKNLTITSFYGVSNAETDSDGDITSVLKSRRAAAAKAAEEKAKRQREEAFRRNQETAEMRETREKEQFERRFVEGIALAKEVYRHTAMGTDRNHQRYWIFSDSTPGLYIEKGWAPNEINYCVNEEFSQSGTDSKKSSPKKKLSRKKLEENANMEMTVPHTGQNLWFAFDSVKDVEQLMQNLNPQGIRESALKTKLQEHYDQDASKAIYVAKQASSEESPDGDLDLVEGFRTELLAMETGLRNGGLGGVDKMPVWDQKLKDASSIKEFGELLIECQEHIAEKFRSGILAPIKQKVKIEPKTEEGQDEEEEEEYREETIVKHEQVLKLQEAIAECPTFSRLHFLMGIVESCIKWEKSAENAKCKICRKKGDDLYLLLCDDCNHAYHLYCLRPALPEIPEGDWFCPSCRPLTQRRCRREATNYKKLDRGTPIDSSDEEDDSSDEESSDGELVHEEQCAMCGSGGDEQLIPCSTCVSVFHMHCHDPPLTREPRAGTWKCMQCRSGVRLKTRKRRAASDRRTRWTRKDFQVEESEEEEEEEEESEDEEEEVAKEESEEESEEEQEEIQPKRPTRETQRRSSSRRQSQESDTDSLCAKPLASGRRSSTRRSQQNDVDPKKEEMKVVADIVQRVMKNRHSQPFLYPVNAEEVPDYYDIVVDPIDLQAMQEKCEDGVYDSAQQYVEDMALLFDNGDMYNKPDSKVGKCVHELEKVFLNLLSKMLPKCKYQRNYNRATMESIAAHGYSDHAYC